MNARELSEAIGRERVCESCPLAGKVFVGMDADGGGGVERTLLFLGLNPGREEAAQGRPFVGKSGTFLRNCLERAGIASWAMVNSILCFTPNQAAIPDEGACHRACRPNLAAFVKRIRPKVIVPCGNGAGSIFGLGEGIGKNSKLLFVSRGPSGKAAPTLVAPIRHPSALIRSGGEKSPDYDGFMSRLAEIAGLVEMAAGGFDESFLESRGVAFTKLFQNTENFYAQEHRGQAPRGAGKGASQHGLR